MLRRQIRWDTAFELFRGLFLVGLGLLLTTRPRVALVFVAVWLAIGLRFGVRGLYWLAVPGRHLLLQPLARFGDPRTLAAEIDAEIANAPESLILGSLPRWRPWRFGSPVSFTVVTQRWLIRYCPRYYHVIATEQVVWVYKLVTAKSSWFAGESFKYAIAFVYSGGGEEHVGFASQAHARQILDRLIQQRPELLVGYRGDYVEWRRTDARSLDTAVERRRNEFTGLSDEDRGEWELDLMEQADRYPRRLDQAHPETFRD